MGGLYEKITRQDRRSQLYISIISVNTEVIRWMIFIVKLTQQVTRVCWT